MKRILIANRGEIALRILRACQQLGKKTVAVYTPVDANLPHLDLADETVCISHYLSSDDIVMAGITRHCDAVHPGYGLLSENADFARSVEMAGMSFIGPSPEHIALLGDKIEARKCFAALGIESIPGSAEAVESLGDANKIATDIGYPLVVKAAFGGGGRGIREVASQLELDSTLALAMGEAEVGFGRAEVFIEKLLVGARHIEVQVLGDGEGGCIHLGTRDCSVQRRYQKLIEECPALNIDIELSEELLAKCVAAISSLKYRNAATLEFLFSGGEFYFLEANTRLQVEHPVTEVVTRRDIVVAQIQIAETARLPFQQQDLNLWGHGIECRILAEDGSGHPSPGEVTGLRLPGGPGVRIDSHIFVGYQVPHQYDSLIAKLVVEGETREIALARLKQALAEFCIEGIATNLERLIMLVNHTEYTNMRIDTGWNPQ
jgi:acetyl-CoA carboxylase biotin carboxylase subunit